MCVCVCVCVYVFVCICVYLFVFVRICMYLHAFACACVYLCFLLHAFVCTQAYGMNPISKNNKYDKYYTTERHSSPMLVCVCVVRICVYLYACMYEFACICLFVCLLLTRNTDRRPQLTDRTRGYGGTYVRLPLVRGNRRLYRMPPNIFADDLSSALVALGLLFLCVSLPRAAAQGFVALVL